jgi:hypothetical protein
VAAALQPLLPDPRMPASAPSMPADAAALRRLPRFESAMREAAHSTVALYNGNRVLNALMNDRARALFSHVALYLHYGGYGGGAGATSGLTVGALRDICVELDLCSRGRCEVLLTLMRGAGFFVAVPTTDKRRRPLAPTEKLLALHRQRWGGNFRALSHIRTDAERHCAALEDPAFVRRFVLALGERFVAGWRIIDQVPELASIVDRNAGIVILLSLALQGGGDAPFPPTEPVPLSINALAKSFAVSRKHVLTLLRDAEGQGLLVRGGPGMGEVRFLPRGRDAISDFFATVFLYLLQCAEQAGCDAGG